MSERVAKEPTLDDMRDRYRKIAQNLKEYREDVDQWNRLHPDEVIAYDDAEIVALLSDIRMKFAGKTEVTS